jgi:hypothetical protein
MWCLRLRLARSYNRGVERRNLHMLLLLLMRRRRRRLRQRLRLRRRLLTEAEVVNRKPNSV